MFPMTPISQELSPIHLSSHNPLSPSVRRHCCHWPFSSPDPVLQRRPGILFHSTLSAELVVEKGAPRLTGTHLHIPIQMSLPVATATLMPRTHSIQSLLPPPPAPPTSLSSSRASHRFLFPVPIHTRPCPKSSFPSQLSFNHKSSWT